MCVSGYPALPVKTGPTLTIFFSHLEKKSFWSEKSPYQGPKYPITKDACFHDLHTLAPDQ